MNTLVYELDPKGDIFLVLDNVSQDLPPNLRDITTSPGWPDELNNPAPPESDLNVIRKPADEGRGPRRVLQIRASSKHLILACPQFERSLQDGFQEGTALKATGRLEFPVQDWEAIPFLILMLIIHHRSRMVPRQLSLDRIVEMARLVDYYECYEAVEPFVDSWLISQNIKSLSSKYWIPGSVDRAERWIFISWVFNEAKPFKDASIYLESKSTGMITFNELPVPRSIQDAINSSRRALISGIIEFMQNFFSKLRDGPDQCSEQCDCVLLGALTKGMHRSGILLLNSTSSFEGISFTQLAKDCRSIKTPEHSCRQSYSKCTISGKIDPLLRNVEKLNVGLDISKFSEFRSPHS
ncbi:hypothetical protein BDV30DRAFT_202311 [Aspergillus minisclerotigenes]|uniref:BTB domain-containing protein n=1 Tax=Aspergillus minisclerotigenes TaxID=656917 RepID=A0A5N6JJT1_9EURO|nr:hypothetical protein BDV30DRAFT_202311 [Aspergillus minisclerotigenes]